MKEWSILIKVMADTKESAIDAAIDMLNLGNDPDEIGEGNWTLVKVD